MNLTDEEMAMADGRERHGTAPAAMLLVEMTTTVALGAVITHAPALTDFVRDPFEEIETGD